MGLYYYDILKGERFHTQTALRSTVTALTAVLLVSALVLVLRCGVAVVGGGGGGGVHKRLRGMGMAKAYV